MEKVISDVIEPCAGEDYLSIVSTEGGVRLTAVIGMLILTMTSGEPQYQVDYIFAKIKDACD